MFKLNKPSRDGVDVCLWSYNHEKYISACLDAILRQEFSREIKVFIHDDCSTDNTLSIITDYAKNFPGKIDVYQPAENQWSRSLLDLSLSGYRYFFSNIKAEYFCIMEADDFWCDTRKLQKQSEVLDSNAQVNVVFHGVDTVNEEGRKLADWMPASARRNYSYKDLMYFNYAYMHTSATLYRNNAQKYVAQAMMSANGDMFHPHCFGAGGDAVFLEEISPSGYRQTSGGIWASAKNYERIKMKLNTACLMISHLISIDEHDAVVFQTKQRLLPLLRELMSFASE